MLALVQPISRGRQVVTIRKRMVAVSMAVVLVGAVGPQSVSLAGTAQPDATSFDGAADESEAAARTFRQMFGLDDDPALIQYAATSPEYSSSLYGVPLSKAEEAEMQRRAQVEQDSAEASAFGRGQETWAGFYYDQKARGRPVFLFTSDVESNQAQIAKRLPSGSDFRVEQVSRSLDELTATQEAIVDAYKEIRASGVNITGTSIDIVGNGITVAIDGLTDEGAAIVRKRFGSYITFVDEPAAGADSCPSTDCRPLKGGIKIVGVASGKPCTAGFIVRRALTDALSILTAGHCIWGNDSSSPSGERYYHTSGGVNDTFGTTKTHTFYDLEDGDVGIIELDAAEVPAVPNRIWTHPAGGSGIQYYVSGWVFDADQTVGSQACAYGYRSNAAYCTTVTIFDATRESCATSNAGTEVCHDIKHTKV